MKFLVYSHTSFTLLQLTRCTDLLVKVIRASIFWVQLICHQPSPQYGIIPQGLRCPYLSFNLIIWGWEGGNHLPDPHTNSLVHSHFPIYAFRGDFYTASKETVKNVIVFPANANSTHKAIWEPDVISKHMPHWSAYVLYTQSCTHITHKHCRILEPHEKKHWQVQAHATQANINKNNVPKCSSAWKLPKKRRCWFLCAYTTQI